MSTDYAFGTRPPYDDPEADMADRMVEELVAQSLSAFRNMLMERIIEDVRYEIDHNYVTPDGWEDWYADNKDRLEDSVYDQVYDQLTYKLNNHE